MPNDDNTAFLATHDGSARRFALKIRPALYDIGTMQAAINRAVNSHPAIAPLLKVAATSTHKAVADDGTTGAAIEPDAPWRKQ